MKLIFLLSFLLISSALSVFSQKLTVQSPNQKISVAQFCNQNNDTGERFLKTSYKDNGKTSDAIPRIDIGLSRSDQDF